MKTPLLVSALVACLTACQSSPGASRPAGSATPIAASSPPPAEPTPPPPAPPSDPSGARRVMWSAIVSAELDSKVIAAFARRSEPCLGSALPGPSRVTLAVEKKAGRVQATVGCDGPCPREAAEACFTAMPKDALPPEDFRLMAELTVSSSVSAPAPSGIPSAAPAP